MSPVDQLKVTRALLKNITDQLSDEQLIRLPDGYPNNILWQLGHIVTVQQRLMYSLSQLPMRVPEQYLTWFAPGTSPTEWEQNPNVSETRDQLLTTVDQLEVDLADGLFKAFTPYTPVSIKVEIATFEDAIAFNTFHEGVHSGMIMSMRRLVM